MYKHKMDLLRELYVVLQKYNATIAFECGPGSDTYGLYDETISINIGDVSVFETGSWELQAADLKGVLSVDRIA